METYAVLGRYNLSDASDPNSVRRKIARMIVHSEFSKTHRQSEGDIGLLIMESPVRFTNYIQPICLPAADVNVYNINGVVAGFGRPEIYQPAEEIAKYAALKTIDLPTCYDSSMLSTIVLSKKSFCASSRTSAACLG
jgi:hypothetical protein